MKKILFLAAVAALVACGNQTKSHQAESDSTVVAAADIQAEAPQAEPEGDNGAAEFIDQFTLDKLKDMLGNQENAVKYGFTFVYKDEDGDEEMTSTDIVYGRDVEKGKKQELGYELVSNSAHACYFQMQLDTSTQAFLCFKSQDDANRFFEKIIKSGIVKCQDQYVIVEEKLAPGDPVIVDSFSGYTPIADISAPEFNNGYYCLHFDFFV
ncbi:MAG: hypothetical protein IJ527_01385 [Prevotella sp.]|nr:hypothetical protein [Prevotella sp.]